MKTSVYSHAVVVPAFPYGVLTTGVATGTVVDTGVYGNNFHDVLFALTVGTIANGTFTVTLHESDTAAMGDPTVPRKTWGTLPVFDSNSDDTVYYFGATSAKRYVRLTVTVALGAQGGPVNGVAILSQGRRNPPARA